MPMSRIYNPFVGGGVGPTPGPQAEEVATLNFEFTDTSKVIFTAPVGAKIISAMVVVSTAFDDPNASIMIGDSTLNNRLMLLRNLIYLKQILTRHIENIFTLLLHKLIFIYHLEQARWAKALSWYFTI